MSALYQNRQVCETSCCSTKNLESDGLLPDTFKE